MSSLNEWLQSNWTNDVSKLESSTNLLQSTDDQLILYNHSGLNVFFGIVTSSNSDVTFEKYVTLRLTDAPRFNVLTIVVNHPTTQIVLCGVNELMIVYLPKALKSVRIWRDLEASYLCRSKPIGPSEFCSNASLQILDVKWHPGSVVGSQLCVLGSDCVLRIYNTSDVGIFKEDRIILAASQLSSSHMRSMKFAMGEAAVSFDFGEPIKPHNSSFVWWPLYYLHGNGDVYYVETDPLGGRHCDSIGPLTITPPSEDNYSGDACSLLMLNDGPIPVLILATKQGVLMHCVVIADDEQNFATPILCVYEIVELDLMLGGAEPPGFTSDIRLFRDPYSTMRYSCVHDAGVHMLTLPWLPNLLKFEPIPTDQNSILDIPCLVDHVLCTKPIVTCQSQPICGTTLFWKQPDSTLLINILIDYSLSVISLRSAITDDDDLIISHLKNQQATSSANREYFVDFIKKLIRKCATVPALKSTNKQFASDEYVQMLNECIQTLRTEYIEKLHTARMACEKRVKYLNDQRMQQVKDLKKIGETLQKFSDKNAKIVNSLKIVGQNRSMLSERLLCVLEVMKHKGGQLSQAEEQMLSELQSMQKKVEQINLSISSGVSLNHSNNTNFDAIKSPDTQMSKMMDFLKYQDDQIRNLRQLLENMNLELTY